MGLNQCCIREENRAIKKSLNQNEGEIFIRQVATESKLKGADFNLIYKIFLGEEFKENLKLSKKEYLIQVSKYGDISISYLYEPDVLKNPLATVQACFFSYVAVNFSKQITKVDTLKILQIFLAFLRNSHMEKLKIFCLLHSDIFPSEKEGKANYQSLRKVTKEYLLFVLHNVTYEISLTIFNEINRYRELLKDINYLCKIYSERNIDYYLDSEILNSEKYSDRTISTEDLSSIWREKTFLFDFCELRNHFLDFYCNL